MPKETRLRILRDGREIATVASDAEAAAWLHRTHPYSWNHALLYEGYRVVDQKGTDVLKPYSHA